ncbi:hypothetical protein A1Q1_04697 [Trichosporon asahii var. asahii CBS 2479]|uniref:Uncharacterized protein n=1 Tax=Trichosporon asahii var. asahii (strain ATCC 90039 / CBS 2479 / JCM 2466 / KCTC 7840 / NBRC 103889/ NCYC 2677 / UAMH 7654) TaxID=1186058 RepID=J6EVA7_TRIAS|nr:hypothetical protein A1Q1_04697 [Trichosporon asahii var. asahii CBS 2479]EJT46732.1 hypothetical protein A1Q1_04697 [Trichosporon asahii var. asahii CBS 2479]
MAELSLPLSSPKSHPSNTTTTKRKRRTPAKLPTSKADTAQRNAIAEWNRVSRQIAAAEAAHLRELRLRAEIGQRCRASHAYQLAHPSVKNSMRARIREAILREREERMALMRARRAANRAGVKFEDEVGMEVDSTEDGEGEESEGRGSEGTEEEGTGDERREENKGTVYMQLRRWAERKTRQKDAMLTFQEVNRRHLSPQAARRLSDAGSAILSSPPPSPPGRFSTDGAPPVSSPPSSLSMCQSPPRSICSSSTSSRTSIDDEPIHTPVSIAPGVFVEWNPTAAQLVLSHPEAAQESCLRHTPLGTLTPSELSTIEALCALPLKPA